MAAIEGAQGSVAELRSTPENSRNELMTLLKETEDYITGRLGWCLRTLAVRN